MKLHVTPDYMGTLSAVNKALGHPIFVTLKENYKSEPHFPGAEPAPMKRSHSSCLLHTVEFAYALCNTDELTTDPYVEVSTRLGHEPLNFKRRLNVDPDLKISDSFHYVKDMPFYIINRRGQSFIAQYTEDEIDNPVVVLEPTSVVPKRSLVLKFLTPEKYLDYVLQRSTEIWSEPNQLLNQVLQGITFRGRSDYLTLAEDDISSAPGVTIAWDVDEITLALYYVPMERVIKAEQISRRDYIRAIEEAEQVTSEQLAELGNVSKNKAVVDMTRNTILRKLYVLKNRYG